MTPPGTRVGAVLKADQESVHLLGYGVYDGDHPHVPFPEDPAFTIPTPRITLDDGQVIWGSACWWGPAERITAWIAGRRVVNVPPSSPP